MFSIQQHVIGSRLTLANCHEIVYLQPPPQHHTMQCLETQRSMLAQKQTKARAPYDRLPDHTQRGIVKYIQHHRDQKFATYCNKDIFTFGKRHSTFRDRVQRFYQDLQRGRNRKRLEQLINKFAQEEIDNKMMTCSGLGKRSPAKTAKSTAAAPRPILKTAPSENPRGRFIEAGNPYDQDDGDDEEYDQDQEYIEDDDDDDDNVNPRAGAKQDNPPLRRRRPPPPRGEEKECKSSCPDVSRLFTCISISLYSLSLLCFLY